MPLVIRLKVDLLRDWQNELLPKSIAVLLDHEAVLSLPALAGCPQKPRRLCNSVPREAHCSCGSVLRIVSARRRLI